MIIEVSNETEMISLGRSIGGLFHGGEVIELVGDVGSGKTTLVRGFAQGMNIKDKIQSPSFTINRVYEARDNLKLSHYDFYRLDNAGIIKNELLETISDDKTITVIEWANIVSGALPKDRLSIYITSPTENSRKVTIESLGLISDKLREKIKW